MNETIKTIDDILAIPVLSKGDKLYHYTSVEGLKGICEGEFWITERKFLNDFTEFQVATDIFGEVLAAHMTDKELCTKITEAVVEEVKRLQSTGLRKEDEIAYSGDYVISFCLNYDSPLMWSEYSDFTGYCMEFDFDELLSAFSNTNFIHHGKVIYEHDEQIALMENAIKKEFFEWPTGFDYINSWSDFDKFTDEHLEDFCQFMAVVIMGFNMFFKLPCFSGENEYRLVFFRIHDGGRVKPEERIPVYFRNKNGVLIPYIKEYLGDLTALKRVMVGAKNNSDIAVLGLQYFFRSKGLDVEIEKSRMPLRY